MLKYVETEVTFSEVPDETTLCINISNCKQGCKNCHSPWLADDIGKPLDWGSLNALIHINRGITCVAFMGGDSDPASINTLASKVHDMGLKACWYSGKDEFDEHIDPHNLDYWKVGRYSEEDGPLDSPTTNQHFYKIWYDDIDDPRSVNFEDITYRFWKKPTE